MQTCREEYKRNYPDEVVVFADFQKKCADRWKTMSEKEKRRFCQVHMGEKNFDLFSSISNSNYHSRVDG